MDGKKRNGKNKPLREARESEFRSNPAAVNVACMKRLPGSPAVAEGSLNSFHSTTSSFTSCFPSSPPTSSTSTYTKVHLLFLQAQRRNDSIYLRRPGARGSLEIARRTCPQKRTGLFPGVERRGETREWSWPECCATAWCRRLWPPAHAIIYLFHYFL